MGEDDSGRAGDLNRSLGGLGPLWALAHETRAVLGVPRVAVLAVARALIPLVSAADTPDLELWRRFLGLRQAPIAPALADFLDAGSPVQVDDSCSSPLIPEGWAADLELNAVMLAPIVGAEGHPWGLLAADAPGDGDGLVAMASASRMAAALLRPSSWGALLPRRIAPDPRRHLTSGELDVLWIMSHHFTVQQAARRLHVSDITVKKRLQQIYDRWGLRGARAVIREAWRLGLLPPPWICPIDSAGDDVVPRWYA